MDGDRERRRSAALRAARAAEQLAGPGRAAARDGISGCASAVAEALLCAGARSTGWTRRPAVPGRAGPGRAAWLIAHDDHRLEPAQIERLAELVGRHAAGEPVAHLVGHKEFHGLRLRVSPARPASARHRNAGGFWASRSWLKTAPKRAHLSVVDLEPQRRYVLAIRHRHPAQRWWRPTRALTLLAGRGATTRSSLTWSISLPLGDWWGASRRRFDLALSNPRTSREGSPFAGPAPRTFVSPHPGGDGLDARRRIVEGAAAHLAPGGPLSVALEHGHDQADAVFWALMRRNFDAKSTFRQDLAGKPRCTGGRLR